MLRLPSDRSSRWRCSVRNGVLRNFEINLIKKETLAQVFSCEFCEIFKNIFFTEHLWVMLAGSMLESTSSCNPAVVILLFGFLLARCNVGLRCNGCGLKTFNNVVLNKLNVGYKTTLEAACNKHNICYNCISINFEGRDVFRDANLVTH